MTTVLSTLFISLDGVAEIDPDWHFPYFDEAMGKAVGQDYADTDVLVLGRVTFDSFAGAWPAGADGERTPPSPDSAPAQDRRDRGSQDLGWRNAEPEQRRDSCNCGRTRVGKVLVAGSLSVSTAAGGKADRRVGGCWYTRSLAAEKHLFDPRPFSVAVAALCCLPDRRCPTCLRARELPGRRLQDVCDHLR
jgi:hypothetical protein